MVDEFDMGSIERGRTGWAVGGALFLLAGVCNALALSPTPISFGAELIGRIAASTAIVLFAIGPSKERSVTDRRPLGTAALVVFALVIAFSSTLLAALSAGLPPVAATAVLRGIELALGVVATVQIARAAIVPRPWNWLPFWAVVAVAVATTLVQLVTVGAAATADAVSVIAVGTTAGVVGVLAQQFLGVVSIVLADRSRPARQTSDPGTTAGRSE